MGFHDLTKEEVDRVIEYFTRQNADNFDRFWDSEKSELIEEFYIMMRCLELSRKVVEGEVKAVGLVPKQQEKDK